MLTSLLPGLRELRAPLAAGYLWLITTWIALASRIPAPETASGVLKDIYRLGEAVGKAGVIAAVTFAAYIVGILTARMARLLAWPVAKTSVAETRIMIKSPAEITLARPNRIDQVLVGAVTDVLVRRYWDDQEFRSSVRQQMDRLNVDQIRGMIEELLQIDSSRSMMIQSHSGGRGARVNEESIVESSNGADGRVNLETKDAEVDPGTKQTITWAEENDQRLGLLLQTLIRTEELLVSVGDDLRRVPARLVGKEQEIYERWDRLNAESEFRLSIALPLLVLSIVLAIRLSPISLLLVVPTIYLLYEGRESRTAADIQLAETIRAERITSPPLARLKSGEPLWRFQ